MTGTKVGPVSGFAARAEFGNDYLLTTAGGIIVCNASGVPVQLAPGARGSILRIPSALVPSYLAKGTAGQTLGWDANDAVALYPPGYCAFTDQVGAALSGTGVNVETTLLAGGAQASLWPAGVTVGDAVRVQASGTWHTGASSTWTLNIYSGSTVVMAAVVPAFSNTADHSWGVDMTFNYATIGGAGAGKMRLMGYAMTLSTGGGGMQNLNAVGDLLFSDGVDVTVANNAAATFDLKAVCSVSNINSAARLNSCRVTYHLMNR